MRRGIRYSLIAGGILLLASCSGKLQTYDLSEEYATSLHYQPLPKADENKAEGDEEKSDLIGVPARSFYGGDLKRGGIWWAGIGISLEKGDVFEFEATEVGPDSIPFGATFPPLDLLKEPVFIKISARSEGKDSTMEAPTLYLQLGDIGGYQTNAKPLFNKIENSSDFKDYYYDMRDVYVQSIPKKHKVNGVMINSLKFFINPGQSAYTGKIFIKEIKVTPVPAGN